MLPVTRTIKKNKNGQPSDFSIQQSLPKNKAMAQGRNITPQTVAELIKKASIEEIESGIVKYFLYKNNIKQVRNIIIKELEFKKSDSFVFAYLVNGNFNIDVTSVELIFELLIPKNDVQLNGAVYTPAYIVNYMVQNTIDKIGYFCDPACGSGIFLLCALKRLKEIADRQFAKLAKPTLIDKKLSLAYLIEKYLYGIDILDYAVKRTKVILSLYLLLNGEDKEIIDFNIAAGNSLHSGWQNIFKKTPENGNFDFIISNPPYVRIQDLHQEYKFTLPEKWNSIGKGNFNLYFPFFEVGCDHLKNDGKLCYITPNNYFTSIAGFNLRAYLKNTGAITKILNFNHLKLFENAQTYTAITFLEKSCNKHHFKYYYVEDKKELNRLNDLNFGKYYFSWLDDKKWRLLPEKDFLNIKKIESTGIPLGKKCNIKVGIATLKDNIFFVEAEGLDENFSRSATIGMNLHAPDDAYEVHPELCIAKFNEKEYKIEKEITRKVIKIPEIKEQNDILSSRRRIIFPYLKANINHAIYGRQESNLFEQDKNFGSNGTQTYKVMKETYIKSNFPQAYKYLMAVRLELAKRDRGKKTYPEWYAWGRTQGMNFCGPRLYTKTFSKKPLFILDDTLGNLFCNGYAIFCNDHIKAVQKILNSKIMHYYIKKTSVEIEGDYQCYQKNFIERFGIPDLSEENWLYLENEEDKENIDNFLMEAYGIEGVD